MPREGGELQTGVCALAPALRVNSHAIAWEMQSSSTVLRAIVRSAPSRAGVDHITAVDSGARHCCVVAKATNLPRANAWHDDQNFATCADLTSTLTPQHRMVASGRRGCHENDDRG